MASKRPEWVYFISYAWSGRPSFGGGMGFGNMEITSANGILGIEDIRELEAKIRDEHNYERVVITHYLYLRHASVKPVAQPAEPAKEVA